MKFQDERGVPHVLVCDGLLAPLHPARGRPSHGVLFIDRMEKEVRAEIDEAVKALAKETHAAAKTAKAAKA